MLLWFERYVAYTVSRSQDRRWSVQICSCCWRTLFVRLSSLRKEVWESRELLWARRPECGLLETLAVIHAMSATEVGIPDVIDMVVAVCQLFTKVVDF